MHSNPNANSPALRLKRGELRPAIQQWWSFFANIVNGKKLLTFFARKLYHRCLIQPLLDTINIQTLKGPVMSQCRCEQVLFIFLKEFEIDNYFICSILFGLGGSEKFELNLAFHVLLSHWKRKYLWKVFMTFSAFHLFDISNPTDVTISNFIISGISEITNFYRFWVRTKMFSPVNGKPFVTTSFCCQESTLISCLLEPKMNFQL